MDERLRQLERDASAGVPGARAAWLAERVRAGTLERDKLRLAAYLGDADARAAAGEAFEVRRVVEWVEGLSAWGVEPCRDARALAAPGWNEQVLPRTALALARAICPAEEGVVRALVLRAVEVVERWLATPSRTVALVARRTFTEIGGYGTSQEPVALGALALLHVSETKLRLVDEMTGSLAPASWDKGRAKRPGAPAAAMAGCVREALGEQATRARVRDALVPWLLA